MAALETVEAAADLDLITLAREGRSDALAELWSRHYDGAVRTAMRWTANAYDAEDVASEAFSRMLAAVGEGGGPTGSVGGYLAISVRNLVVNRAKRHESGNVRVADPEIYAAPQSTHANPVADRVELGLVREAFSTLPMRWRVVLWRTAVDRDTNQTLAKDMGMTANAVAALAARARAGFRAAYLQAHVSRGAVDPACQPFIVLLPPLVSGGKASLSLTAHLQDCIRCQDRAAELLEIERHLAALIFPAVLVAGWSQLGPLRPGKDPGSPVKAAARPRAWVLAAAGSAAAAAIVVAGIAEPEVAPASVPAAAGPGAAVSDQPGPTPATGEAVVSQKAAAPPAPPTRAAAGPPSAPIAAPRARATEPARIPTGPPTLAVVARGSTPSLMPTRTTNPAPPRTPTQTPTVAPTPAVAPPTVTPTAPSVGLPPAPAPTCRKSDHHHHGDQHPQCRPPRG